MTAATTHPDPAALRAAVADVPDPELPPVTVGMLGMVHDVTVDDDGTVTVTLLPTFAGCPATDVIAADVRTAVGAVAGVGDVVVRFAFDPPWTPARISDDGRAALRAFGIAPPTGPVTLDPTAPAGAEERSLPVLPTGGPPSDGLSSATSGRGRPCPWCGATDTVRDGLFGPTPCRDTWFCDACNQPFEGFKS